MPEPHLEPKSNEGMREAATARLSPPAIATGNPDFRRKRRMPCIDPPDPNFEKYAEAKNMLCALLRNLEAQGRYGDAIDRVPGLRRWWEVHKAEDALERARKS